MKRKILAAVDGSVYSYNAIRYLSHLFTDLGDIHVDLLCVVPTGPVLPGQEWLDELEIMSTLTPQARARMSRARRFMEEAVLQLGRRGIDPEQITTKVQLSRAGVAADIKLAARQGLYDALLIGRRGISKLEEMFMGSISSTMAKGCYGIPLWVVEGKVNSRKFLMPVDGTFNSLKAADHLGFVLAGNPHVDIFLYHFTALFGEEKIKTDTKALHNRWGEEWCNENLSREDSIFHAPHQMLVERGVSPQNIKRLGKSTGFGATRHIVRRSEIDNCGTIVIGRRDICERTGIFKGVSDKVMQLASHVAIWLVG